MRQNKSLEQDGDSIQSHPALRQTALGRKQGSHLIVVAKIRRATWRSSSFVLPASRLDCGVARANLRLARALRYDAAALPPDCTSGQAPRRDEEGEADCTEQGADDEERAVAEGLGQQADAARAQQRAELRRI